jgi:uncharacterized protein (TIGR00266 family)
MPAALWDSCSFFIQGGVMAGEANWYVAKGQERLGPMTLDELARRLPEAGGEKALVYGPDMSNWVEARHVGQIMQRLQGSAAAPPPIAPVGAAAGTRKADVIDYEIFGSEMQYVEITLDPQEMVVAEAGAMMYMTSGIKMETVLGDPSKQDAGFMGKLMSAGKRVLTGESLFITTFSNASSKREVVAFAAPYPGKIIPMDLQVMGGELICQKDAFLCAARGVSIGIALQKKMRVGFFGGEGFIMQRLTGDGLAMVHAGGTLLKRTLMARETLKVDTGCIVAYAPSVNFDIQFVGGIKNSLFGGEGLFFATLTGPGDVWLQSLPFSRLAGRMVHASSGGKEEGSVLGKLGGLIGGDNS